MNKRGQIYILAAILVGFTLVTLTSKVNYAILTDVEDNFKELSENYDVESSKFINSLLEDKNENVLSEITGFTQTFEHFAKNQNPDFGLIFLFPYKGSLYVENFLNRSILVDGQKVLPCSGQFNINIPVKDQFSSDIPVHSQLSDSQSIDCIGVANSISSVRIIVGEVLYNFEVNENTMELIILSNEEKGSQRKVFLNNKILRGELIDEP